MTEFSTPFVNMRYLLHTHKRSSSTLYVINGLTMTFVFFLVRPFCLGMAMVFLIPKMVMETD